MNIKGVFQLWTRDGGYYEIPLKEAHAYTREGCLHCPDFAAEHADLSTGGIGAFGDWTLVIVRTDLGREILSSMKELGLLETRPGDDDPGAVALLHKLARVSRRRWPEDAVPGPRRLPVSARLAVTTRPAFTTVLLVRHGTTTTTGTVLPGRAPGLHLADAGRDQAAALAARLHSCRVARVRSTSRRSSALARRPRRSPAR